MADETLELPPYQARVLFLGANGTGKSELARHMLVAGDYDYVAIDTKGDFSPPHEHVTIHTPDDWRWRVGYRHIVYRPTPEFMDGKPMGEILRRLYLRARSTGKRKPFVVYVDEALAICRFPGAARWLQVAAVSGRGLKMGLWIASQRPRQIPVEIRSEAWIWYVFFLTYAEDEEEVVRYSKGQISVAQLESGTEDFAFWRMQRGHGGRILVRQFAPLRIEEDHSGEQR